jgi:protein phosphatase-4 regulatory subunit 3
VGTDVALSFQESNGCNHVWTQVADVQEGAAAGGGGGSPRGGGGSPGSPSSPFLRHHAHRGMIDEFDTGGGGPSFEDLAHLGPAPATQPLELPEPELAALPATARVLADASPFQRDSLAAQALRPGYLSRLLACFATAEDVEDETSLGAAHEVVKGLLLLNDTNLLEALFSDEHVAGVAGALEHDPALPPAARPRHRDFLAAEAAAREAVPVADPAVRAKVRQANRLGYFKDAALPRALDDGTFATLSSLQLFNSVEVVLALHARPDYLPELFRRLRAAPPGGQDWRDLVAVLQELTSLARHLQASQRNALLARLAELGLYPVLTGVLASGDGGAALRAADVLLADVAHDPSRLRAFLQGGGPEGEALFGRLVGALASPSGAGLQEAALEVLRGLLDPDTMEGSVEKDHFIDLFYDAHIGGLLAAVVAAAEAPPPPSAPPPATLALLLDLLCFCVTQHSYRIKYYILRNNVVEKVLRLLRRREGAVGAAALRFLRTCLAMRDEFYNRYLVKNALLEPVITALLANGRRYNLVNSAALELFEFVRRENMKGLLAAVVESPQWGRLVAEVDYVDTFRLLQAKHEANVEGRPGGGAGGAGAGAPPGGAAALLQRQQQQQQRDSAALAAAAAAQRAAEAAEARRRRGEREEDTDEENYFREDDDDDEDDDGGGGGGAGPALPPAAPPPARPPGAAESGKGHVVLESLSPLPGLLGGRLVDYDDEDEDATLPLRGEGAARHRRGGACASRYIPAKACLTRPIRHPP